MPMTVFPRKRSDPVELKRILRETIADIDRSIDAGDAVGIELKCGVRETSTPHDEFRTYAPTVERTLVVRYASR